MGKLTEEKVTVTGKSGTVYEFDIYSIDTEFVKFGGIYIFCKRTKMGNEYDYEAVYCGKTNNLSTRFDNHHKMPEIKKKWSKLYMRKICSFRNTTH